MLATVDTLNYTHVIKLCYADYMAKKPGPKPGPRPERRVKATSPTRHVTVRIPEDDYATISAATEVMGVTLSEYIRAATMGTATADPSTRDLVLSSYVSATTLGAATLDPITRELVFTAAGSAIPDPNQIEIDLPPPE